jgi:hypothetical protein
MRAVCGVFRVGERCFSLGSILAAAASPPTRGLMANKGVRWFNVRARTFLARGAKQYVELLQRYAP